MPITKIPLASTRKPQKVTLRRPQSFAQALERQLLKTIAPPAHLRSKKTRANTQGHVIKETHHNAGPTKSACSNKHVVNSNRTSYQSTTSTSVKPMQQKSVNTNLITEDTAALITKTWEQPSVSGGFCDRLTITYGDRSLDTEIFSLAIHDLTGKAAEGPYLARFKPKNSQYTWNYRIKSSNGRKLAILQLKGKVTNMNFARLDLNPAAIGEDGVSEVQQLIAMLFGDDYRALIGTGRVTRLDASLDVVGQHVNDLIAYTVYPQQHTYWMRNFPKNGTETWILGTQYLGSQNSGRRFMLYDKERQLFEVKGIRPSQARTRIELKYRADKCGCSADAKDVLNVGNPLLPLKLAYFPCQQNLEPSLEFFLLGVREWGLNPALSKVGDKNKRSVLRRTIGKQSVDWWQPDGVWKGILGHLQSLNLFPNSFFTK